MTTPVTGGRCKLQWKPDWAMRWVALGVDYEMAGKDLIDSVKLSGEICRALGGTPPEGFNYELFLDEKGQKISKSKGNGLTIEEWLRYASPESLSLFMYREPKAAKRLYFDVIPRHVDEYQQFLDGYQRQDEKQRLSNPVWHIHAGNPPQPDMPITFSMLLTLVSSSNAENAETLWGFIGRYRPGVTPQTHPKLDALVGYAIHYFRDFVLPKKKFREPTDAERAALSDLRDALSQLPADATAEQIQNVVYEIGRREPFLDTRSRQGRQARRVARLVQHALPGAARAGEGTALRLLRGGLRRAEHRRDDRRRARALGVTHAREAVTAAIPRRRPRQVRVIFDDILVTCPKCGSAGTVRPVTASSPPNRADISSRRAGFSAPDVITGRSRAPAHWRSAARAIPICGLRFGSRRGRGTACSMPTTARISTGSRRSSRRRCVSGASPTASPTARWRRGFRRGSSLRRTARRCCARLPACAAACSGVACDRCGAFADVPGGLCLLRLTQQTRVRQCC